MRISVVTSSYNQGKFIEQTIRSVIEQKFPDYEHIIVDGGSTDHTGAILNKYKKVIQSYRHKGEGQVQSINWGLRRAKGDVVGYINADDYYLPGAFNRIGEAFSRNTKVRWLTADYVIVNDHGKSTHKGVGPYKYLFRKAPSFVSLLSLNYIAQPSTFWAKSAMARVGYFDSSLQYAFDYDYWLRMMRRYPLYVLPDKLSAFRIHRNAKGWLGYRAQFEEDLAVAERYTPDKGLKFVHRMHNKMIVWMYDRMKK